MMHDNQLQTAKDCYTFIDNVRKLIPNFFDKGKHMFH